MNENEQYVSEHLEELIEGLEPKTYRLSLKLMDYDQFVEIARQERPDLNDEELDFLYARLLVNNDSVRKLQRFGRTRDEMIKNLGDVVESNKRLRDAYFKIVEEKAKTYPEGEKTLAQELGIEVPKIEYSFDEQVKRVDYLYLRLTLIRKDQ
jgi:hypothetical protein